MIDSYILYHKKVKRHILFFLIFVISLLLFIFILLNKVSIPVYIEGIGTITNSDGFILETSIPLNDLKKLNNHNQIMINQEKYNYQVQKVSRSFLMEDGITYVIADINIDNYNEELVDDEVSYKIEIGSIKIIDQLIKN
jgi:hypothetical protein